MHLRAIYWFLSLLNIYFTLLTELIETGPMRALICSTGLFDQDKIPITMKMSSLMKFRIIDHELRVCEYSLRADILHIQYMYISFTVQHKAYVSWPIYSSCI
jgi:hypothetical protein